MKSIDFIVLFLIIGSCLIAQDFYDIETINNVELTFSETNWDEILDNLYIAGNEERLVGTAVINGVQFDSVGVRYKGNSSYSPNNVKNPLNIKLDHIINDQTYDGYGTLKLSNGFKDPSFVRETLSYEIATNYMPASKANYCTVIINGELIGLYTSVQDVDKLFKNTYFPSNDDIRIKGELTGGPSVTIVWGYLDTDSTSYYDKYELESDYGWAELIEFLDVFNNSPDEMDEYLNVDRHLWMLAFDNLMVNLDAPINFGHNYYLFRDNAGKFNPILWDLNENFGVFAMILGGPPLNLDQLRTLDPLLNINNPDYPIIQKVLSNDKYQKMYIAHMRTIIEEFFENGYYEDRANQIQQIIESAYQADPNTFYTINEFEQNITNTVGGGPGNPPVIGITQLMDPRIDWLLNHELFAGVQPEIISYSHSPVIIEPNSTIWINSEVDDAEEVYLYHREVPQSSFIELQMFDDGNHNDGAAGDGVYGISIECEYKNIEYYFYAQNSSQGKFSPGRAANEFYELDVITETGDVVINEINYHSADDFNPDDWVEIYNASQDDIDISGWEFKDEDDTHIFVIPNNTILAQNDYLVLCRDAALFNSIFPSVSNFIGDLGFGLSGGGEPIRLFDAEGTLIDSVDYDDEDPWPVQPDGNGPTLELIDPTYDNSLAESWQVSEDHGTPGSENSSGASIQDEMIELLDLNLHNYPNPFNPTTTISFELNTENTEDTELVIYNLKGQKVKQFQISNYELGINEVIWSGKDDADKPVSSGVYFYKLTTVDFEKTNKMLLMK